MRRIDNLYSLRGAENSFLTISLAKLFFVVFVRDVLGLAAERAKTVEAFDSIPPGHGGQFPRDQFDMPTGPSGIDHALKQGVYIAAQLFLCRSTVANTRQKFSG